MHTILLQAPASAGYGQFILLGGMILIFYLFFIRPQQKKQKETKKFLDNIKKGDYIVTVGGIHGKITQIETDTVTIDVDKGNKLVIERSSISQEASKKYAESDKS